MNEEIAKRVFLASRKTHTSIGFVKKKMRESRVNKKKYLRTQKTKRKKMQKPPNTDVEFDVRATRYADKR